MEYGLGWEGEGDGDLLALWFLGCGWKCLLGLVWWARVRLLVAAFFILEYVYL